MIAAIDPQLRLRLDDPTIDAIVHAVQGGVPCLICSGWLRAEIGGSASVVALRERHTGETLVRFAHPACSPSRMIEVDRLPGAASDVQDAGSLPQLTWALSARRALVPTIVLVWDAACVAQLGVGGRVLLDSLALEGMRGGRPIERLSPPRLSRVSVGRVGPALSIETPDGRETLVIEELEAATPALHVAARQGEVVLVVGEQLGLGGADLDQTDLALVGGDAVAAIVAYSDPELATISLRAARRARRRRSRRGRLPALTPSARRHQRLAREFDSERR